MYCHDGKCYLCQNSWNESEYNKTQKVIRISLANDSFQLDLCKDHLQFALTLFDGDKL